MSPTRRSTAPRKRPVPGTPAPVRAPAAKPEATAEAAAEGNAGEQAIRRQVLARLEATVRDNPDLDDDGRAWLMRHYRDAVDNADIDPTRIARPDRKQWIEMLETLQADGQANEEDVADLVRRFDEAMGPLESPQLEMAVEFARRCRQDGEAQAVQWLEARRAAADESRRATAATGDAARVPPDKTPARRTRSPRGPPA